MAGAGLVRSVHAAAAAAGMDYAAVGAVCAATPSAQACYRAASRAPVVIAHLAARPADAAGTMAAAQLAQGGSVRASCCAVWRSRVPRAVRRTTCGLQVVMTRAVADAQVARRRGRRRFEAAAVLVQPAATSCRATACASALQRGPVGGVVMARGLRKWRLRSRAAARPASLWRRRTWSSAWSRPAPGCRRAEPCTCSSCPRHCGTQR